MSNGWLRCVALALALCIGCAAQTTQALVSGRIVDRLSGRPVIGALITYRNGTTGTAGSTHSDSKGYYTVPSLSPGNYRLLCSASGYQAGELWNLELPVAGRLDVPFRLRPLKDVWEAGQYRSVFFPDSDAVLPFYGPDLDPGRSGGFTAAPHSQSVLEASVSDVIELDLIDKLPLAGRDVYATLAVAPGVSADTTTSRGLGLSVNGQRPASSNFLLDGVENNNVLVTGPLTALAPEMIQEYRISTSSWSAEYGGTAGYLTNAITRAGGEAWHGAGWFNLKNDALNANDFQNNAHKLERSPFKENQYGFQTGGPVWKKKLFASAGLEVYRSRSYEQPVTVKVPSPLFVSNLSDDNPGKALLTRFPTPATDPGDGEVSDLTVRPAVSINRYLSLARGDYVAGSRRITARLAIDRTDWPDFIWYPYKSFLSALEQPVTSVALGYSQSLRSNLTHELRGSFSRATTGWERAHPEIPTLAITTTLRGPDDTIGNLREATLLPGSPALYGLRDTSRTFEVNDNWLFTHGDHILKAGGGLQLRHLDGSMSTGRDGRYTFDSVIDFLIDNPGTFTAALNRGSLPKFEQPNYERTYRSVQYFLFAEDTWRAGRRFVLNGGIRYDNFGAPVNTGAGNQKLWSADNRNIAPRVGFSWDGTKWHGPVVRGGYGIFFDRPFGNLWEGIQNNSVVVPPGFNCAVGFPNPCANYLASVSSVLPQFQKVPYVADFPSLTQIDPRLRSGYAQSFFLGTQQRISEALSIEVNGLGSLGRALVTTDVVNRGAKALPGLVWRSNQGKSNYDALTATARYRARSVYAQASWTWSHSIDNQSDPLAGEFFDLSFVNFTNRAPSPTVAGFARQADSAADRGSANFDQRHNVVVLAWFDVPGARGRFSRLTRGWRLAEVAAFRTGFPYSVLAPATGTIINQRADIGNPGLIGSTAGIANGTGSVALLNKAAFGFPKPGVLGSSGRNALRGPGLWNADISLSRTFGIRRFGEAGRLVARADFYNALNHANLNNPNSLLGSAGFGQASYGRLGYDTGFPALVPLNETARQVQIILKLEF